MSFSKQLLEEPWENENWCLNVHLIRWWGNKRAGRFMSGVWERWDQGVAFGFVGMILGLNTSMWEWENLNGRDVISWSWKETVDRTNTHPLKLIVSLWRPSFELMMFLAQLYLIVCFSYLFLLSVFWDKSTSIISDQTYLNIPQLKV